MSYTPNESLANISRGHVTGSQPFGSFGKRTATGAVTIQVLWPNGAFVLPSAAGLEMTVVSTSAQDSAAGTGIRTIDIHYLDPDLGDQIIIVNMNGTTPVVVTGVLMRFIQCLHGTSWGSGKAAAGTITVSNGGQTYSEISIGENRCTSSARMVPAGKRLMVNAMYSSSRSPATGETSVSLASTHFDGHDFSEDSVFLPIAEAGFQDNGLTIRIDPPMPFSEGACVAMLYTQASTATVTGGWFGWLENA